jgi:cytochrome b561
LEVEKIIVAQSSVGALDLLLRVLYVGFLALMISGWIYLLMKVSEISRNAGAIAGQLELHSSRLASIAESVAVLARNSVAQKL